MLWTPVIQSYLKTDDYQNPRESFMDLFSIPTIDLAIRPMYIADLHLSEVTLLDDQYWPYEESFFLSETGKINHMGFIEDGDSLGSVSFNLKPKGIQV